MDDPHEVLGVSCEATRDEIEAAFKRLAREHHPDAVASRSETDSASAHHRMQQVTWAYAVLTNPVERDRFDRLRLKRSSREPAEASTEAAPSKQPPERDWRARPAPRDITIRELSGWGDAHWLYVHAPGGRAGTMNVTTGEVTIEREELRDEVMLALQHHVLRTWG